jgi:NADPH2:quinone reductase
LSRTGSPDVLTLQEVERQELAPYEAWIEHEAIGVNFLDVMQRSGSAPVPLPSVLGLEAAGRVAAVGAAVRDVAPGDRVGYILGPLGAYSSARAYPADRLIRLPDTLDSDRAAAALFKGITAQYLLKTTFPVRAGTNIVVYGAAGPLGQIIVQWAKHLGARVIGVVSRSVSVERARSAGCDAVFVWGDGNLPEQVSAFTAGAKAHVVYDGVGRETFDASLDCLATRGVLASIGASSGPPPLLDISRLNSKGSLYVTRPSLAAHASDVAEYRQRANDVLAAIEREIIKPAVGQSFSLADVGRAHEAIESGISSGAVILKP